MPRSQQVVCRQGLCVDNGPCPATLCSVSDPFTSSDSAAETAERLRAIMETAVEGIITIDERGIMDSVNAAACATFGYTADEMSGKNVSMLMPEPDSSRHDGYLERYFQHGDARIIGIGREVTGRRKDGSTFPMDLSVSEVLLPGRRLFTGFVRDISARKEQERALADMTRSMEEKNRELEALVYAASHDLRSPLVNIQGFAGELAIACDEITQAVMEISMDEKDRARLLQMISDGAREPLEFISAGTAKIDRLMSGLLRVSRLGRAAMRREEVDLNALLRDVLRAMEYQTQQTEAQITVGDLPECLGDDVHLNQVFTNLLDNALKYRAPERPIRISITGRREGDQVVCTVQDNGIGIPQEHTGRIFQIFHRLSAGGGGEGLGLTIVQRILDRMGGSISVTSAIGEGTAFHVTLPAAG